jgi:hypothetical protein
MRNHDCIETLKREFLEVDPTGGDEPFLVKLRIDREWDREAFSRLVTAMKVYCEEHAHDEHVERWVAHGFWYLQLFTREFTTHPHYPKSHPPAYYEAAHQLIDDLAYWFFVGEHGYQDEKSLDLLIDQVGEG